MSDAREEAAIAREALVRGKKKQKKQTTLMTKWNIVLDYGESGVSMADYCAEYNGREGRALGVVIEESKLCRWSRSSASPTRRGAEHTAWQNSRSSPATPLFRPGFITLA